MEEFSKLISRIRQRARWVRGIERAWPPTALALLLMIGYQAARLFGLAGVGAVKPQWIALADLAIVLGGFLWGYLGRVDLAQVLFRADRRLGLHERLSSLYELHRGRGHREFIPILSSRLPPQIDLAQAVPLPRRGLLLLALLLTFIFFLVLGLPRQPFLVHHRPAGERWAGEERSGIAPELLRKLAEIEEELAELQEEVFTLELEPRPEVAGKRSTEALQGRLEGLEEEIWGPSSDPSLQEEVLEQLAQAISSLEGGLGLKGSGPLPPELLAELDRMAGLLEEGALKELLRELPQASEAEVLRSLSGMQALIAGLAEAQEKLEGYEQLLGQPAESARGEGEGVGETPRGAGESERPSEEGGPPGGEEAGTSRGEGATGEPSPLTVPSEIREFHIPGELGELGEVEQLITKGTPFELETPGAEGGASLRLSFQRVNAILRSREIPDELREVVKQYFLLITEEW